MTASNRRAGAAEDERALDALLDVLSGPGPSASALARLAVGLDRLARPAPRLPWAWMAVVTGLFALAALWDLRSPCPPPPERGTSWRYHPELDPDGVERREGRADPRHSAPLMRGSP